MVEGIAKITMENSNEKKLMVTEISFCVIKSFLMWYLWIVTKWKLFDIQASRLFPTSPWNKFELTLIIPYRNPNCFSIRGITKFTENCYHSDSEIIDNYTFASHKTVALIYIQIRWSILLTMDGSQIGWRIYLEIAAHWKFNILFGYIHQPNVNKYS